MEHVVMCAVIRDENGMELLAEGKASFQPASATMEMRLSDEIFRLTKNDKHITYRVVNFLDCA
jgi:hypothetical protein